MGKLKGRKQRGWYFATHPKNNGISGRDHVTSIDSIVVKENRIGGSAKVNFGLAELGIWAERKKKTFEPHRIQ